MGAYGPMTSMGAAREKLPLFVSDMSFGALSEEAKIALSKGLNSPERVSVQEREECCPKNKSKTLDTFMSMQVLRLATMKHC